MTPEEATDMLQKAAVKAEAERDQALGLLREIWKHQRLTDKNVMRFTITIPEVLYDRVHKFLKDRKEGT